MTPIHTMKEFFDLCIHSTALGYRKLGGRVGGYVTNLPNRVLGTDHQDMKVPAPQTRAMLNAIGMNLPVDTDESDKQLATVIKIPTLEVNIPTRLMLTPYQPPIERADELLSPKQLDQLKFIENQLDKFYTVDHEVSLKQGYIQIQNVNPEILNYGLMNQHRSAKFCNFDSEFVKPGYLFDHQSTAIAENMKKTAAHYKALIRTCLVELQIELNRSEAKHKNGTKSLTIAMQNYGNALVQSGVINQDNIKNQDSQALYSFLPKKQMLNIIKKELKHNSPFQLIREINNRKQDNPNSKIHLKLYGILNPSEYEAIRAIKGLIPTHDINGRADFGMQPPEDEFKKLSRAKRQDPEVRKRFFERVVETFSLVCQGEIRYFEENHSTELINDPGYIKLKEDFLNHIQKFSNLDQLDATITEKINLPQQLLEQSDIFDRRLDPIYDLENILKIMFIDSIDDHFNVQAAEQFDSMNDADQKVKYTAIKQLANDLTTSVKTISKLHQGGQIESNNTISHPGVYSRRIQSTLQKMRLYTDLGQDIVELFERYSSAQKQLDQGSEGRDHSVTPNLSDARESKERLTLTEILNGFDDFYQFHKNNQDPQILSLEGKIEKILRSNDRDGFIQVIDDLLNEIKSIHCHGTEVLLDLPMEEKTGGISQSESNPHRAAEEVSKSKEIKSQGDKEYDLYFTKREAFKAITNDVAALPTPSAIDRNFAAIMMLKGNHYQNSAWIRGSNLCHENDIHKFQENFTKILGLLFAYQKDFQRGTAMVHQAKLEAFNDQMQALIFKHLDLTSSEEGSDTKLCFDFPVNDKGKIKKAFIQSLSDIFTELEFKDPSKRAKELSGLFLNLKTFAEDNHNQSIDFTKEQIVNSLTELLSLKYSDEFVGSTIKKELLDKYFIHSITDPEQAVLYPLFAALRGDPQAKKLETVSLAHNQSVNPYSKGYFGTWQPAVVLAQNFGSVHTLHSPWMILGVPVFNVADIINTCITTFVLVPPVAIAKSVVLEDGIEEKKDQFYNEWQSPFRSMQTENKTDSSLEESEPVSGVVSLKDKELWVDHFGKGMRSRPILRNKKSIFEIHALSGTKTQWRKDGSKAGAAIIGSVIPSIGQAMGAMGKVLKATYSDTAGKHSYRAWLQHAKAEGSSRIDGPDDQVQASD